VGLNRFYNSVQPQGRYKVLCSTTAVRTVGPAGLFFSPRLIRPAIITTSSRTAGAIKAQKTGARGLRLGGREGSGAAAGSGEGAAGASRTGASPGAAARFNVKSCVTLVYVTAANRDSTIRVLRRPRRSA
jgi:hypothetical protein